MDGFEKAEEKAVAYALQCLNSPDLQLKPEQENSLRALYSGKDTFVWLPTGFGKSICYTALPFLYDSKLGRTESTIVSLTLVISPLVSLITDQVVDLRSKGVGSAVLTSAGEWPYKPGSCGFQTGPGEEQPPFLCTGGSYGM